MNASEFAALTETAPQASVWNPTDEDLHRLFWSPESLAYLDRVRGQAVTTQIITCARVSVESLKAARTFAETAIAVF